MNREQLTGAVQAALTPDLLKPEWRKPGPGAHPHAGHCYVASEALWHLLGGQLSGFVPVCARCPGGVHWWLQDRTTGAVLDPTAAQFDPATLEAVRAGARPCGFLTKYPSQRARVVINRVLLSGVPGAVWTCQQQGA